MKVRALAERSGKWWAVEVPDVAGGIFTQARRLDQIPHMVADAVALVTEVPYDEIEVEVSPQLPAEIGDVVERARAASRAASEAQEVASRAMRTAVADLAAEQLTNRDSAELLGITFQRVSQLAKA